MGCSVVRRLRVDPVRFAPGPAVKSLEISQPSPLSVSRAPLRDEASAPAVPSMVQRRPESTVDPSRQGGAGEAPVGSAGAKPGVSIPGEADSSPYPVGTPGRPGMQLRRRLPHGRWRPLRSAGEGRGGAALAPAPPILLTPPMAPVQRRAEITADVVLLLPRPLTPRPPLPSHSLPPGRGESWLRVL